MKSFALATVLASANAYCNDYADCDTQVRCEVEVHGPQGSIDCWFPGIKRACCNAFQVTVECHQNQQCMANELRHWPPAEMAWLRNHQGVADACPGIRRLTYDMRSNVQRYCRLESGEALDEFSEAAVQDFLMETEYVVMTAQQPDPEVKKAWVPGVFGFAAGAAVVTTAAVALKKKKPSAELYLSLNKNEVTA